MMPETVDNRFWSKVERRGDKDCWPFTGYIDRNGRGHFHLNGKTKYAHQVSAWLYGIRVPDGKVICHRCDNAKCCNPGHFFIGTQTDNIADMDNKGRRAPYSPNFIDASVKYPREKIDQIKAMATSGIRQFIIADSIGVSRSTVSLVLKGKMRVSL